MGRLAIATLSTENLLHNLTQIQKQAQGREVMAMIKANGYGHGLRSTALRLDGKVHSFGVASIDEALALRKVGIKGPIILMSGAFEPEDIEVAAIEDFQLIFHEKNQLDWLDNANLVKPIKIWLKVNTGMGRLGFALDQAVTVYQRLSSSTKVMQPIGIISHLACSDEPSNILNQIQINNFREFTKDLPGPKTLLNSGGIFSFTDDLHDLVRPGLALYGVSPFRDRYASDLGLKPVMTLQSKLVAVSTAKAGSSIGYGSRYICPQDMLVGVIAMGYGDGYPRTARDGMPVLVNNIRCQLVGRVSMDMATIDLSHCHEAKVGDPVILWGEGLPIEEIALYTDNIPYDIICGVQQRVKFYWI